MCAFGKKEHRKYQKGWGREGTGGGEGRVGVELAFARREKAYWVDLSVILDTRHRVKVRVRGPAKTLRGSPTPQLSILVSGDTSWECFGPPFSRSSARGPRPIC